MSWVSFKLFSISIPFRERFSHASAVREQTSSIWVEAILDGVTGYGEGCPRPYVSGENIESARIFFNSISTEIERIKSVEALKVWVNSNREIIDRNPAAWCAVELSLLDLFGKLNKATVESLLNQPPLMDTFKYSAVLGQGSMKHFMRTLEAYSKLNITDMKLKLTGNLEDDNQRISYLKSKVPDLRLRLDANNFWNHSQAAESALSSVMREFFAVEEPVQAGDYHGMEILAENLNIKIILDESFLRAEDIHHLYPNPKHWIINLRVSKMGGLIRSIKVIEAARKASIPVIIGAQVGETSLLTRAGLSAASAAHDILIAQEGAFGTYLLTEDVSASPLMFSNHGELQYPMNEHHGLGMNISLNPELFHLMNHP